MYRDIPRLSNSFYPQNCVTSTFNKVNKQYFKGILSGNKTFFIRTKETKQICVNILPQMQVYINNNKAVPKILQSRKDDIL